MEADRLTVLAYTADPWESACPRLRITGPCQQSDMLLVQGSRWDSSRLAISFDAVPEADLIVIQRDFPRWQDAYQEIMDRARAHQKPVIYELDDWLLGLPEDHPDYEHYRSARAAMLAAISAADGVTASTATLCEYLSQYNPRTWLLPNCLDDRLWVPRWTAPAQDREQILIGYMGGSTHTGDLEMIAPALVHILQRFGDRVRLQFWGRALPPPSLLGRPNVAWDDQRYLDYALFAAHFSEQTPDIVLAPLRGDSFGRAKSAIKFLEYSVLGAAGIYSAVTPYIGMVNADNGILASTLADWEQALVELIEDPERRRNLGQNARQTVREHWMLSQHTEKWVRCYREVVQAGKVAPAAPLPANILQTLQGWEERSEARLTEREASIRSLQTELAVLRRETEPAQLQLADARRTIQSLMPQLAAQEAALQSLTSQTLRQAEAMRWQEAELQQMRRSITWRGTEPVRQAFAQLQKLRARLDQKPFIPAATSPEPADETATAEPETIVEAANPDEPSESPAEYRTRQFFWDAAHDAAVIAQPTSPRVEIVICVGKNTIMAQRCVASIKQHTDPGTYRLNLVVHEQDAPTLPESLWSGARLVTHSMTLFNFAIANNLALARCAPGDDVVLLNDDTEVTSGWLEKLRRDSRGVALTGARTGYQCSGNPDMWGEGERRLTWYPINMFCAYIPSRVRAILGGLDEEFFYYGGEDVDYSCRALQHGFPLVVSSAFVHHAGNQSFQGTKERLMQESDKIIYDRYGLTPPFDLSTIKPLVSVVIATRNRATMLPTAARSILGGAYPELELIIVDDNSSDHTWDAITELQYHDHRVLGIRLPQQWGLVRARYAGVHMARGCFIAFMDDDDLAWPNRIMAPLEHLLLHPELDVAYCGFDIVSENGRQRGRTRPFDLQDYLDMKFDIGSGILLMRHRAVMHVPFMPYYERAIDYDWVFRLVRRGYRIDYCPAVVLDYNRHGPADSHLAGNVAAIQQHKTIQEREKLMNGLRRS